MNGVVSPDSRPSSSKLYRAAGQDARRGGRGKRVKKSRTLGHPIVDVGSDEKEASSVDTRDEGAGKKHSSSSL